MSRSWFSPLFFGANTTASRHRPSSFGIILLLPLVGLSFMDHVSADELLGYWEFNDVDDTTNALDTVAGRVGSLRLGAAYTADAAGRTGAAGDYAMDFGAVSPHVGKQQVHVSDATFLNTGSNAVSYSFWVQLVPNAEFSQYTFSTSTPSIDNFAAAHEFSGLRNPGISNTVFYTAGQRDVVRLENPVHDYTQWSHLALVKDGNTKRIWLDGMNILERDRPELLPTDFTQLCLGSICTGGFSLQGKLDDFAIFDGALTAEQIGRLAAGESALSIASFETVAGDFNADGVLSEEDIDALTAEIVAGSNNLAMDLTGDDVVDDSDLNKWRFDAAMENGYSETYLLGDSNLDGSVDAIDLNNLALNWRQSTSAWSGGDFTTNGVVDSADLNALALNWRVSIPSASAVSAAVPEPSALFLTFVGLALTWRRTRQVETK